MRQRKRETETERDRQRDGDIERQKNIWKESDRKIYSERGR